MFWRFRYTKKTVPAWEAASVPPTSPSRSPTKCEGCAGLERNSDAGPTPQGKAVRNHSAALLARPYPRHTSPAERKPAQRAHTRLRGRSGRHERRPGRPTFPWPARVGQLPTSPACPAPSQEAWPARAAGARRDGRRAPGTRAPPHPPGAEEKEGEVRRTQTAPSRARALVPSPAEFNTMPTPTPCATPRPAQQPGRQGRGGGPTRRGEERAREPETARDSKKPEARVRAPACERGGGAAAVAAAAVGAAAAGRSAREAGPAPVGPDPSPPPPSLLPSPKPTSAACGLAAEEAAAAAAEGGGASEGLRT